MKMEDNLNTYLWKTTSMFFLNGNRPQFFGKMELNLKEDDHNFKVNGRRPKFLGAKAPLPLLHVKMKVK
jgi:hypothetical protein